MKSFWKTIVGLEWLMAAVGAGTCLMLTMLITMASIAGRYFLHADVIPGAYNIVERVLFPVMVFCALPLVHREKMFPYLEMLVDAAPAKTRAILSVVGGIVEIVVYLIVTWYTARFVIDSFLTNRGMQIGTYVLPLWPVIFLMPIAFALMVIEMLRSFLVTVTTISKRRQS